MHGFFESTGDKQIIIEPLYEEVMVQFEWAFEQLISIVQKTARIVDYTQFQMYVSEHPKIDIHQIISNSTRYEEIMQQIRKLTKIDIQKGYAYVYERYEKVRMIEVDASSYVFDKTQFSFQQSDKQQIESSKNIIITMKSWQQDIYNYVKDSQHGTIYINASKLKTRLLNHVNTKIDNYKELVFNFMIFHKNRILENQ